MLLDRAFLSLAEFLNCLSAMIHSRFGFKSNAAGADLLPRYRGIERGIRIKVSETPGSQVRAPRKVTL
jgi:hypothetical protein